MVDPGADGHAARRPALGRLARSRSAQAARRSVKPLNVQVVSLDWKWLFIYPEQGHRQRQPADHSRGYADQFRADLIGRDEQLLRAAARQPDLHDGRHDDAPAAAGRQPGTYPGASAQFQRRRLLRHAFRRRTPCRRAYSRHGSPRQSGAGRRSTPQSYAELAQPSQIGAALDLYGAVSPGLFATLVRRDADSCRPGAAPTIDPRRRARVEPMLGKLSWNAIPLRSADPLFASGLMILAVILVLAWITLQRVTGPISGASGSPSVDHKRIGVMYCVLALVMLLRGFTDAIMMRSQQALAAGDRPRLSAARTFRPDFLGARHHHDLLHGDAVHDRADELRGAAAARRSRRRVSDLEFGQPVADRVGRAADQPFAGHRRVRQDRLDATIRRSASCNSRPGSASTIISGRCKFPASAR